MTRATNTRRTLVLAAIMAIAFWADTVRAYCTACKACPAGSYNSFDDCIECPVDTYTDTLNRLTICTACPAGKTTKTLTNQTRCYAGCPSGQYQIATPTPVGFDVRCANCTQGTAKSGFDFAERCVSCPFGTDGPATELCPCGPGYYKPVFDTFSNTKPCLPCDAFSIKPGTNYQTSCASCGTSVTNPPASPDPRCSCPAGYFREFADSTNCTACPVDTYLDVQNTIIKFDYQNAVRVPNPCKPCAYGMDTRGRTGASTCYVRVPRPTTPSTGCREGEYLVQNPSRLYGMPETMLGFACALCAPGTSRPVPSTSTSCLPICRNRPYIDTGYGSTLSACPCHPGLYLSSDGSDTCLPCPVETYQPNTVAVTSCTPCPEGQTTFGASGMRACIVAPIFIPLFNDCPAGYYLGQGNVQQMIEKYTAKAHTFEETEVEIIFGELPLVGLFFLPHFSGSEAFCIPCPVNLGMPNANRDPACIPCRVGVKTLVEGTAICPCPPGEFVDLTDPNKRCAPCQDGKYAPAQSSDTSCTVCPPGTKTYNISSTRCVERCVAGSYFNLAHDRCEHCPAGQYSESDASNCFVCPAGFTSYGNGTQCVPCPLGTVSNPSGICVPCPPGFGDATINNGTSRCAGCPPGRTSFIGTLCTFPCNASSYSSFNTGHLCLACPTGFTSGIGASSCFQCRDGQYLDNARTCRDCPQGRYSARPGVAPSCTVCPAGAVTISAFNSTVLVTGRSHCVCPPGMFGDGNDFCSPCDYGTYSNTYDTAVCTSCGPGTSTFNAGSTSCSGCPPGTYSALGGMSCIPCRRGTFSLLGATTCRNCSDFQTSDPGSSSCFNCGPGTTAYRGDSSCSTCTPGRYSPHTASDCSPCPIGHFSGSPGAQSCPSCNLGTIATAIGTSSCSACAAGSYSSIQGTSCIACSKGYFSTGSTNLCSICSAGSSTNTTGQTRCSQCTVGKISSEGGQCVSCPVGLSTPGTGYSSCSVCTAGKSTNGVVGGACVNCAAGKFSSGGGPCQDCDAGTSSIDGANVCSVMCPAGRYTPGGTPCLACPAGKVSALPGAGSCVACAQAGFDSPGEAPDDDAVRCHVCPPGRFPRAGSACTICPAGQQSIPSGGGTCTNCSAGYTSVSGQTCTACAQCTTSVAGSPSCSSCPLFYDTAGVGSASCSRCKDDICSQSCAPVPFDDECYAAGSPCGFLITGSSPCTYDGTTWRNCDGSAGAVCRNLPGSYVCECDSQYAGGVYPSCIPVSSPCSTGTYSSTGTNLPDGCTVCPYGQTTLAAIGAIGISNCTCLPGNYLANSGNPTLKRCTPCPVGSYSTGYNTLDQCTACPGNSTTFGGGALSQTACRCVPGYHSHDGQPSHLPCVACESGKFAPGVASPVCNSCPVGYTTLPLGVNNTARITCATCANGYIEFASTGGSSDTGGVICRIDECVASYNGGCDNRTSCIMNEANAFVKACSDCSTALTADVLTSYPDMRPLSGNGGGSGCFCPAGYYIPAGFTAATTPGCIPCSGALNYTASSNVIGSCLTCASGYVATDDATGCVDVDECADGNNGGCSTTPLSESLCTNTAGSRTCGPCSQGFQGTGIGDCTSVCDNTTAPVCDPLTVCINYATSAGAAVTCTGCPDGYTGNGLTGCIEYDPCVDFGLPNGGCDALTDCFHTGPGQHECGSCPPGYTGTGDTVCMSDPCSLNNGGCDLSTTCTNVVDALTLVINRTCGACPAGYDGDGYSGCVPGACLTIEASNGGCDSLVLCINNHTAPSGRTCGACPTGYTGTGDIVYDGITNGTCTDLDECTVYANTNGGCGFGTTCSNTEGSRSCDLLCASGYAQQRFYMAQSVDALGPAAGGGGANLWTIAILSNGSAATTLVGPLLIDGVTPVGLESIAMQPFTMQLYGATGAVGDGGNAGGSYSLVRVDSATGRVTIIGSFGGVNVLGLTFSSQNGVLYATGHAQQQFGMPLNLYTINLLTGEAVLVGPIGYSDDFGGALYAWPMYEAFEYYGSETLIIAPPWQALPVLAAVDPFSGSITDGILQFNADDLNAIDSSHLVFDLISMTQGPWNSIYTFGLVGIVQNKYSGDSFLASGSFGDSSIRLNGSLPFASRGIVLDQMCLDVDECADGNNGGCSQTPGSFSVCTNTAGGFSCSPCADGFSGSGLGDCEDIDECASNNGGCDPVAECINTPGSWVCGACPAGYFGTGDTECVPGLCVTQGGANGGCDPHTQCLEQNATAPAMCSSCPTGFTLSNSSLTLFGFEHANDPGHQNCQDIDECAVDENGRLAACEQSVQCVNYPGYYSCGSCRTGFARHTYALQGNNAGTGNMWDLSPTVFGVPVLLGHTMTLTNQSLYIEAVAVHPITHVMYGVTAPNSPTNPLSLVLVNKRTARADVIGPLGSNEVYDLTFSPDGTRLLGTCFISAIEVGAVGLCEIDIHTGAASLIQGSWRESTGGDALTFLPLTDVHDPVRQRLWVVHLDRFAHMQITELDQVTGRPIPGTTHDLMPLPPPHTGISGATVNENQTLIYAVLVDQDSFPDLISTIVVIDPYASTVTAVVSAPFAASALDTECTDVNECLVDNGGCSTTVGSVSTCTNTQGSRTCSPCASGFTGTGVGNCTDINECTTNNGGCSRTEDSVSICTNTPGSRVCGPCASGFSGSGVGNCSDINECLTANGGCLLTDTCINTRGSRTCISNVETNPSACARDVCLNGGTCVDVGSSRSVCVCPAPWFGASCNQFNSTQSCGPATSLGFVRSPCNNGGTCSSIVSPLDSTTTLTQCACTAGWTGPSCRVKNTDCAHISCALGSLCTDPDNVANGVFVCTPQSQLSAAQVQQALQLLDPSTPLSYLVQQGDRTALARLLLAPDAFDGLPLSMNYSTGWPSAASLSIAPVSCNYDALVGAGASQSQLCNLDDANLDFAMRLRILVDANPQLMIAQGTGILCSSGLGNGRVAVANAADVLASNTSLINNCKWTVKIAAISATNVTVNIVSVADGHALLTFNPLAQLPQMWPEMTHPWTLTRSPASSHVFAITTPSGIHSNIDREWLLYNTSPYSFSAQTVGVIEVSHLEPSDWETSFGGAHLWTLVPPSLVNDYIACASPFAPTIANSDWVRGLCV